jgi:phosphate starvation-inducible PhoH-like protein
MYISQDNHNTSYGRKKQVNIIPRSRTQEAYVDALLTSNKDIVFASGPAGTGKTMIAMLSAIKHYKSGLVDKIVCTRPAVGVDDEKHGFLPGDLNQKMEPWTRPLFDVLHEYYSPKETAKMLDEQLIEISPLAFMRGRTFKNAYIVADEMQNATPNQMKMLLTRIGEGSKIVVTGDVKQTDRKVKDNGLLDFMQLVQARDSNHIESVQFSHKDIERHPAVTEVLAIYGDND